MRRILSIFIVIVIMLGFILVGMPPFAPNAANAANAADLAVQIARLGLTADASVPNVVTVTGSAISSSVGLNINSDVTVNWKATLTGSVTANNYLLVLSGDGIFTLGDGGYISSSGAGGTMYILGGITLNVEYGALIDAPGSGSAVTIAGGTLGASINVSGGTIKSVPSGYAINDGSGIAASNNNTQINISNGLVEAGSACAVRSTGIASVVTVTGGEIRNAAASNTNSVIYMNYAPAPDVNFDNIIVKGGLVRTINSGNQSYVLQTSQGVLITGGEVMALAGRGINLVGMNSKAIVTGGRVSTVSGTAISTATTTLDAENATIVISGGIVEAMGTGVAVCIMGEGSTVTVSGGIVSAKSGLAVTAPGRPSANSVMVNGGLVFAWGSAITGAGNVINPASKLNSAISGVIAAWNTTTGIGTDYYYQEKQDDLTMLPSNSVYWDINPDAGVPFDGITYDMDKFFELNVSVIQIYYILTINDRNGTTVQSRKAGELVDDVTAAPGEAITAGINPSVNPVNGSMFKEWKASTDDIIFEDVPNQTAVFIMPDENITITALYSPRYVLNVIGGSINSGDRNFGGSASYGYYAQGEKIGIMGNSSFVEWTTTTVMPGTFDNRHSQSATFTMPGNASMIQGVTGTYSRPTLPECQTTVGNGSGKIVGTTGGIELDATEYAGSAGTGLKIKSKIPELNQVFSHWEITSMSGGMGGYFENPYDPDTVFIMLEEVTIEAIFDTLYTLTVNGGEGMGTYRAGDLVNVRASSAELGMNFFVWQGDISGIDNVNLSSAIFTMPDDDAEITATYEYIDYTLEVINGNDKSGEPTHHFNDNVEATANLPEPGMEFTGWVVISGNPKLNDISRATSAFTMPAENVIIKAAYAEIQPMASPSPSPSLSPPPSADKNESGKDRAKPISTPKPPPGSKPASGSTDYPDDGLNDRSIPPRTSDYTAFPFLVAVFVASAGFIAVAFKHRFYSQSGMF